MHSLSERLRRVVSWCVALTIFFLILFSDALVRTGVLYEICEVLGYALIITAVIGRIWCAVYIGGRKDEELCDEGPYSITRNPLYLFSFLGTCGIVLAFQSLLILVIIIPVYWLYYYSVILSEEKRMRGMFGEPYARYFSQVNRILPSLKHYRSSPVIQVKTKVLFKSMMDASVFLWLILCVEIIEKLKEPGANGSAYIPVYWHLPF